MLVENSGRCNTNSGGEKVSWLHMLRLSLVFFLNWYCEIGLLCSYVEVIWRVFEIEIEATWWDWYL